MNSEKRRRKRKKKGAGRFTKSIEKKREDKGKRI
jgi:hypothetical protein